MLPKVFGVISTLSEDDFEKVSTTSEEGGVRKRRGPLGVSWPDQQKDKVFGFDPVFALDL